MAGRGKVSQFAPEFAAAWPFMAQGLAFVMFAWCFLLMEWIPAGVRAVKRFRNADKRRVRRLVRDTPSPRKGEVLAFWHRAHHEALEQGFDPPTAVRRADAAVLRR